MAEIIENTEQATETNNEQIEQVEQIVFTQNNSSDFGFGSNQATNPENYIDLTGRPTKTEETVKTEPVVENTETVAKTTKPITEQAPDINPLQILKEKYGREFDEDYFKTDWKSEAITAKETIQKSLEQTEKFKHIFENKDLLAIADHMKNGMSAKDILQSMAIEPDNIPQEELIMDYVKRNNPYLKTEEDIELFAKTNFGIGEDIEDVKTYDAQRYFALKKNIDAATTEQKAFLNEKKVQLLNTPQQQAMFNAEQVVEFNNTINKHIDSLTDFSVADDFSKPFDKEQLKTISTDILYSGDVEGERFTVLKNVKENEVLEALYFLKNKQTLLKDYKTNFEKTITQDKSIKAFKEVSEKYDNVQGAGESRSNEPNNIQFSRVQHNNAPSL